MLNCTEGLPEPLVSRLCHWKVCLITHRSQLPSLLQGLRNDSSAKVTLMTSQLLGSLFRTSFESKGIPSGDPSTDCLYSSACLPGSICVKNLSSHAGDGLNGSTLLAVHWVLLRNAQDNATGASLFFPQFHAKGCWGNLYKKQGWDQSRALV